MEVCDGQGKAWEINLLKHYSDYVIDFIILRTNTCHAI